jgi:uncharacterized protein YeaO (DUF488 family)
MASTRKSPASGRRGGSRGRSRSGGRIGTKRVYDEPAPEDGIRVLVDRLWPRGIAKATRKWRRWMPELAPSTELRKWYGHDPARFAEFERRYRAELAGEADRIASLRSEARQRGLTLLTATRELALSHVEVLRKVLGGSRGGMRR